MDTSKILSDFLAGKFFMSDLKETFALRVPEVQTLQLHQRTISIAYQAMTDILTFAEKRAKEEWFTYEEDIFVDKPENHSGGYCYQFGQDLAYDHPEVFDGCRDNHCVTDLLISMGFINEDTYADPESGCTYFHFMTEDSARRFITTLNALFVERLRG